MIILLMNINAEILNKTLVILTSNTIKESYTIIKWNVPQICKNDAISVNYDMPYNKFNSKFIQ